MIIINIDIHRHTYIHGYMIHDTCIVIRIARVAAFAPGPAEASASVAVYAGETVSLRRSGNVAQVVQIYSACQVRASVQPVGASSRDASAFASAGFAEIACPVDYTSDVREASAGDVLAPECAGFASVTAQIASAVDIVAAVLATALDASVAAEMTEGYASAPIEYAAFVEEDAFVAVPAIGVSDGGASAGALEMSAGYVSVAVAGIGASDVSASGTESAAFAEDVSVPGIEHAASEICDAAPVVEGLRADA